MKTLGKPVIMAAGVLAVAACTGSRSSPSTTTEPPPATSSAGVPSLTAGPPSRYREIDVVSATRKAVVPVTLTAGLAPLLIARDFGQPPSLAEYGLDHPPATLIYDTGSATITIAIGHANFDRSGFYARRADRPNVYLVLAGAIQPVLALAGVPTG